jgi:hypothetical protein
MTPGRLVQQTADEWVPLVMEYVAVLNLRTDELTARFGWTWAEGEEAGLGTMRYVGLAYDGRSRYVLIASVDEPGRGVALEAAEHEDPAQARADFLAALDLDPGVFLSIREGACWFERWDESKPFREADAGARSTKIER